MCGINGYFSIDPSCEINVEKMNSAVNHRGPDFSGIYVDKEINLVLGHTRLSIIDLDARSNQPFIDGEIIITFNGEIYNYKELKNKYLKNISFKTSSDTEVIIKLYVKFGIVKTLELINGMFSFGLFDKRLQKLFLCRDRIGKKPLYYILDEKKIVFASEVKSFKNIIPINIDYDVINDTLYNRYSKKLSPFKQIELLKNGSYIEIDLKSFSLETKVYFKFADLIDEKIYNRLNSINEIDLIDELEEILTRSVDLRLIADAEVGTINSGGLDSSLVSAMVLEKAKLKMFHIDVEGESETKYAEILANKLKVDLDIVVLKKDEFENYIDKVIFHYEYPLVHPNAFGIFLLSKLANSKNVRVLLSGDGADEIFGGYGFYKNYYRSLFVPSFFKKITSKIYNYCFPSLANQIYSDVVFDSKERIKKIEEKYHFIKDYKERHMQSVLVSSLSEYLQPLNIRADKLGMANSVEFRSPFLDINLVKFAVNLPLKYKLNKFGGKLILKKMAERKLPKKIIYRQKMGFPVPLVEKARLNQYCNTNQNFVLYSKKALSKLNS